VFISAFSEGAWVHERSAIVRVSASDEAPHGEGGVKEVTAGEEQEACPAAGVAVWDGLA